MPGRRTAILPQECAALYLPRKPRASVEDAVFAFLDCGIYEHGLARVVCNDCRAEFLVAFSCQRRGLCPSCVAKRGAIFGALLAEEVLEHAMPMLNVFHRDGATIRHFWGSELFWASGSPLQQARVPRHDSLGPTRDRRPVIPFEQHLAIVEDYFRSDNDDRWFVTESADGAVGAIALRSIDADGRAKWGGWSSRRRPAAGATRGGPWSC